MTLKTGRRIRTVSLCEETDLLAGEKGNFSGWVQQQLRDEVQHFEPCRPAREPDLMICNGMRKPTCPTCYPDGRPSREHWLQCSNGEIPIDRLLELTKERNAPILAAKKTVDQALPPASSSRKTERKYVRRLIRWLWGWI